MTVRTTRTCCPASIWLIGSHVSSPGHSRHHSKRAQPTRPDSRPRQSSCRCCCLGAWCSRDGRLPRHGQSQRSWPLPTANRQRARRSAAVGDGAGGETAVCHRLQIDVQIVIIIGLQFARGHHPFRQGQNRPGRFVRGRPKLRLCGHSSTSVPHPAAADCRHLAPPSVCSTIAVPRTSLFRLRKSRLASSQWVPVALTTALSFKSPSNVCTRLSVTPSSA